MPQGEGLNPFTDDVCAGPFGVAENRSVPGLNGDILGQLTTTIDDRQTSAGRAGGQPLLLLTAPRAGYGNSPALHSWRLRLRQDASAGAAGCGGERAGGVGAAGVSS